MSVPVVVLPSAEAMVIQALLVNDLGGWGTRVGTRLDTGQPMPTLLVGRAGGVPFAPGRDAPVIDVSAYHTSRPAAERAARDAHAVLASLRNTMVAGQGWITWSTTVQGVTPIPDQDVPNLHRYLFTCEFTTRPLEG